MGQMDVDAREPHGTKRPAEDAETEPPHKPKKIRVSSLAIYYIE